MQEDPAMSDTPSAAFSSVAEYYEAMFDSEARLAREGTLLRSVFEQASGRRVTDIACGTGIHAVFLAGLGAEVDAFDLSGEMIEVARRKRPHPAIRYQCGDMREVRGGPWDLALCLGNSLSLAGGIEGVAQTFRSVRNALSDGGRLLIQVLNYWHPDAQQARHTVITKPLEGVEITAVKSLVPARGRVLLSLNFFVHENGRFDTCSDTAVLYPVTLPDLERCAGESGLTMVETWGGYGQIPFDPASSADLIVLLRK